MTSTIKRVALNTGGGDAPGLNAVIRAVVVSALSRGWEVVGIRDGYDGLLEPGCYADGGLYTLTRASVRGISHLGGTILGTTNRGNPFKYPVAGPDGVFREVDRSDELLAAFRAQNIDALIAIGGDGSLGIAAELGRRGLKVVGVPKTIDNDLDQTVVTFGFDSAVSFATTCIDRLNTTAEAHHRVMVVEVMGRYAGWIALNSGVAASADVILIPEIPFQFAKVAEKIRERETAGAHFSVIIVAEGAVPQGGSTSVVAREFGRAELLGGMGEIVAREVRALTGKDTRHVVLGHLLRGGPPTTFDRLISLRFGAAAVRALEQGHSGVMVALDPPTVRYVRLDDATHRMKVVPLDCDTVLTARDLGTSFGD